MSHKQLHIEELLRIQTLLDSHLSFWGCSSL